MHLRYLLTGTLAAIGAAPAAQAFELGEIDIHGFVSQTYINSSDQNYLADASQDGSFEFNQVGINFGTDVTEDVRVGLQLFARDQGAFGNNRVTLDWAYGDWTINDRIGLRAGRMIQTGGLYSEIKDYDFLRSYTLLPQSVYNAYFREIAASFNGVQIYGSFDSAGAGRLSYTIGFGGVNVSTDGDIATFLQNATFGGTQIDEVDEVEVDWTASINLQYEPPVDGLKFLANYNYVDDITLEMSTSGLTPVIPLGGGVTAFVPFEADIVWESERWDSLILGAQYLWEAWIFDLEYRRSWQRADTTTSVTGPTTAQSGTTESEGDTTTSDGGYLGVTWRKDDNWVFGGYASLSWADTDDRSGDDRAVDHSAWSHDFAAVLRYDISHSWLAKAEIHYVNGTAGLDTYNDPGSEFEEDWYYFMLRTSYNF